MGDLADKVFRAKTRVLIPPDHPKADLFCKVLGAGLCTTSEHSSDKTSDKTEEPIKPTTKGGEK